MSAEVYLHSDTSFLTILNCLPNAVPEKVFDAHNIIQIDWKDAFRVLVGTR
jgi:hypothetical protein